MLLGRWIQPQLPRVLDSASATDPVARFPHYVRVALPDGFERPRYCPYCGPYGEHEFHCHHIVTKARVGTY